MIYKELVLSVDEPFRERFVAELLMLNFESFSEDEEGLHAYMPANRWNDSLLTEIRQRLYYHQNTGVIQSFKLDVRDVIPQNWQELWERTITPVYAGKNVVIHPSWHSVDTKADSIDIVIDPKMSFGTGHHETTQMMIELLEEYCKPGTKVLDIGTGSGVLAILAAKMKAAAVIAVDDDPDAITDARENCTINDVQDTVTLYTGRIEEIENLDNLTFEIILANIERKTILELFNAMIRLLTERGILLLSGLLYKDFEYIEKECSTNNLTVLKKLERTSQTSDTWLGIALQK